MKKLLFLTIILLAGFGQNVVGQSAFPTTPPRDSAYIGQKTKNQIAGNGLYVVDSTLLAGKVFLKVPSIGNKRAYILAVDTNTGRVLYLPLDSVNGVSAPIYPATRVPFGDGVTAGGTTFPYFTYNTTLHSFRAGFALGLFTDSTNGIFSMGNIQFQGFRFNSSKAVSPISNLYQGFSVDFSGGRNYGVYIMGGPALHGTKVYVDDSLRTTTLFSDTVALTTSITGDPATDSTLVIDALGIIKKTAPPGAGVTPAALTKTDDANVTLTLGGTPTTALLQATSITAGWTGTLADARLSTTAVTPGSYGSATQVGTFTVGATGRLTSAGLTTITPTFSSLTGTPSTLAGYGITDAYTKTASDARYFQISNNLSEGVAATIRANIGAGTGSGSVGTVSVVTANGVSGSVANPTTTPAITLTLGAITPSTVNGVTLSGSGSLANSGTSSLTGFTGSGTTSGTNTGDQTSVSGNAGTATALQTSRNIYGNPFNGTADVTGSIGLAYLNNITVEQALINGDDANGQDIKGVGNLGIGTVSPLAALHVEGTSYSYHNNSVGHVRTTNGLLMFDAEGIAYASGRIFTDTVDAVEWVESADRHINGEIEIVKSVDLNTNTEIGSLSFSPVDGTMKYLPAGAAGYVLTDGAGDGTTSWQQQTVDWPAVYNRPPLIESYVGSGMSVDLTGLSGTQLLASVAGDFGLHTIQVNTYINITAISAGTLTVSMSWTDENNASKTITLTGISTTGYVSLPIQTLRCHAVPNITVTATFVGASITYDAGVRAMKLI